MAYVPGYNPSARRSLINPPSQQLLSQTYGGGTFENPPTLNANIVPNATGLIEKPQADDPAPAPGAPSQIPSSPLDDRRQDRGEGRGGEARSATPGSGGEPRQVDTTGQWSGMGMGNMITGAMPGGSVVKGFATAMQSLFGPNAVVGMEEVGIGHPDWDKKMGAIKESSRRNEARGVVQDDLGPSATPSNANMTARARHARQMREQHGTANPDRGGDRSGQDREDRARGEGAAGGNENAPAGRGADGL